MIFTFLLVLTAVDPAGYAKSRWGMTEQQVIDAFGGQAVRVDAPLPACTLVTAAGKVAPLLMIPKLTIGTTEYRACFFFTDAKLSRVDLRPLKPSDASQTEFNTLEALLVEKYGKPWQTEDQNRSESRWRFATTRISLNLIKLRGIVISMALRYDQAPAADNL